MSEPSAVPVAHFGRRYHFSAAHRLNRDDWDEATNRRIFDRCNNPHGHGHTYGLEVTVEGEIDPESGYLMDFAELKRTVEEAVIRRLDRRHLNFDVDFLAGVNPTAENIARLIYRQAKASGLPVVEVTLWETENSYATYRPEGTISRPVTLRVRPAR